MNPGRSLTHFLTRRAAVGGSLALTATVPLAGSAIARQQSATPATPGTDPSAVVQSVVEDAMVEMELRAALVHVSIEDDLMVEHAVGESLTGVRASPDMHFRNGAVAITYMAVTLLRLAEEGMIDLDEPISTWGSDLPEADRVTPRMLATMTAGYPDYVQNEMFVEAFLLDPFRAWSPDELIEIGLSTPRLFDPGANWDYSHTNYVILGQVMEAATGQAMSDLLHAFVLDPLQLTGTGSEQSAWMPQPVLHAYSSERREFFGIPAGTSFYEESTFWNPSWTLAQGAVQYTTVADMASSFAAIGRGDLLSSSSMQELLTRDLLGFGAPLEGCPACHTLDEVYVYGLGIVQSESWMLQNPLFGGYASAVGYHPGSGIAIAVATTFNEASFDETGGYRFGRSGQMIFRRIAEALLPADSPLIGG